MQKIKLFFFCNINKSNTYNYKQLGIKKNLGCYEKIFPGVIQAIRNPNAHKNTKIEKGDAVRKLMIASDLMYALDKALETMQ